MSHVLNKHRASINLWRILINLEKLQNLSSRNIQELSAPIICRLCNNLRAHQLTQAKGKTMRRLFSFLTLLTALVSFSLAGPAFAASKNNGNGATGIGQQEAGTPPGKTEDPKGNAPGQQDKQTGKPGGAGDDDGDDGDDDGGEL
jgi:hypothetical protein